jgi:DNA-directed RNA polymerase specialized sigma24 family protein
VLATWLRAARSGGDLEPAVHELLGRQGSLVERVIAEAVQRQLVGPADAPDLANEVNLHLLSKLRQLVVDPDSEPIANFEDYVGTVVRNAIEDLRRSEDPLRASLAYRVRYVLTHTDTLALWGRDPTLCGLAEWVGRRDPVAAPAMEWTFAEPSSAAALRLLVEAILRRAAAPLQLKDLVDAVATAKGLPRHRFVPLDSLRAAPAEPAREALESRQYLEQLWSEIEQLPTRQRVALLLNLRLDDGDSVARELVALGIVGMRRIAAAIEVPVGELLGYWDELPLPDARIVDLLGLTRQQVINLRKAARDRLARRMGRPRRGASSG